jgi:hypothetical protein
MVGKDEASSLPEAQFRVAGVQGRNCASLFLSLSINLDEIIAFVVSVWMTQVKRA